MATDGSSDFEMKSMDATPGFPELWLEWTHEGTRNGIFILRDAAHLMKGEKPKPEEARFHISMTMFMEDKGYAVMRAAADFYIDRLGCLCGDCEVDCAESDQGATLFRTMFACNILTHINTIGTRVEPPFPSQPSQIVKPDRAPCSVWHTIHLPRFAAPRLEGVEINPEILERREHWVRGHRRDYRRGGGMFGRIKALVWVPEFQRGNPELGTVKQSYKIDQLKEA
jgi:hypothetical protein